MHRRWNNCSGSKSSTNVPGRRARNTSVSEDDLRPLVSEREYRDTFCERQCCEVIDRSVEKKKSNVTENSSKSVVSQNTLDISKSKLTATAKEFIPRSQENIGAIRKVQKENTVYKNELSKDNEENSLRDKLIRLLSTNKMECAICMDIVKYFEGTWNCKKCYHIFHLSCIQKWCKSDELSTYWRCPTCNSVYISPPRQYLCFCGKIENPPTFRRFIPHSCGDICAKTLQAPQCKHKCKLKCHPGPCPKCDQLVSRPCCCGQTILEVQCMNDEPLVCTNYCRKVLSCTMHLCSNKCHEGDCEPCSNFLKQKCYSHKKERQIKCCKEYESQFACGEKCDLMLSCGFHKCERQCHEDCCGACPALPEILHTCHCRKLDASEIRKTCLDPVPSCNQICGRKLDCGHACTSVCHPDKCPACLLSRLVRCRCGNSQLEIKCFKLKNYAPSDIKCDKKCPKNLVCGRHKCMNVCCNDANHYCQQICYRKLYCGKHRCLRICHRDRCGPCPEASFEDLACECGSSVLRAPLPCGSRPPSCNQPCTRSHACGHKVSHSCHFLRDCPPCPYLTTKVCYGGHEERSTIPCYVKSFTCGMPCGKSLPCGNHTCPVPCHENQCMKKDQICYLPCTKTRKSCEHTCGLPCHSGPCPEKPCKEQVTVTCACGWLSEERSCYEIEAEYQKIMSSMLASQIQNLQPGEIVDTTTVSVDRSRLLKSLECNAECRLVERNKRLANALHIKNADFYPKLCPKYSDFMKTLGKKDESFSNRVHSLLTELVKTSQTSNQPSRSYSFECMSKDKRRFVHEYCEHFGCKSSSYDAEPNRNVVATAMKGKICFLAFDLENRNLKVQVSNGFEKITFYIVYKGNTFQNSFVVNDWALVCELMKSVLEIPNFGGPFHLLNLRSCRLKKTCPLEYIPCF